tara:strand:- start:184 stop:480 length:297 start_codon:yes stop_codon:yes gene_type:complete
MSLNWKKLEKFMKISKYESLNKASKKIGTSQSTISRDIQQLEKSLNIKLFNRQVSGAKLTPEAKELLKIVNEFDGKLKNYKYLNSEKKISYEIKKKAS